MDFLIDGVLKMDFIVALSNDAFLAFTRMSIYLYTFKSVIFESVILESVKIKIFSKNCQNDPNNNF